MDRALLLSEFDKRKQELKSYLRKEYWKEEGDPGMENEWLNKASKAFDGAFDFERGSLEDIYDTFDKLRALSKKYPMPKVRKMLYATESSRESVFSYGKMVRPSWVEAQNLEDIVDYIKELKLPAKAYNDRERIIKAYEAIKTKLKDPITSQVRNYRFLQWNYLSPVARAQQEQFNKVGNREYLKILLQSPELMIGNRLQAQKLIEFSGGKPVFVASLGSNISPAFFYLSHLKGQRGDKTHASLLHADIADKVIKDMEQGNISPPGYALVPLREGGQKIMVSSDCFTREGKLIAHPQLLAPFLAKLPGIRLHQFKLAYLEKPELASYMKNFLSQRLEPGDIDRLVSHVLGDADKGKIRLATVLGKLGSAGEKEKDEAVKRWTVQFRNHMKSYFDLIEVKDPKHKEAFLSAYEKDPDFFKNLKTVFPPPAGKRGPEVQKTFVSVTSNEFADELKGAFSRASSAHRIDKIFIDISFLIHHLPKQDWNPLFSNLAKFLSEAKKPFAVSIMEKQGGIDEALHLMDLRESVGQPPPSEYLDALGESGKEVLYNTMRDEFSGIPGVSIHMDSAPHMKLPDGIREDFGGPKFRIKDTFGRKSSPKVSHLLIESKPGV